MSDRLRAAQEALESSRKDRESRPPSLLEPETLQRPASPPEGWQEHALGIVRELAENRDSFTVEDVAPRLPWTPDRRALGAVMLRASRHGWIESGPWVNGGAKRHGRPVRLWHSRIYCEDVA